MQYTVTDAQEVHIEEALKTLGMTKPYNEESGFQVVSSAYKKLARTHHPDKGGDAEVFKKISNAYEELTKYNQQVQALQLIGLTGEEFFQAKSNDILIKIKDLRNNLSQKTPEYREQTEINIETLIELNRKCDLSRPQESRPQEINLLAYLLERVSYVFNMVVNFLRNLRSQPNKSDAEQPANDDLTNALVKKTTLNQKSGPSNQKEQLLTSEQQKQDSIVITPGPGQKYVLADIAQRFLRMFNLLPKNLSNKVDPATFTLDVDINKQKPFLTVLDDKKEKDTKQPQEPASDIISTVYSYISGIISYFSPKTKEQDNQSSVSSTSSVFRSMPNRSETNPEISLLTKKPTSPTTLFDAKLPGIKKDNNSKPKV